MKKRIPITLTLVTTFGLGFAFNSLITKISNGQPSVKRATGIGGIFFKCKDPKKMREWYKTHLGLNIGRPGRQKVIPHEVRQCGVPILTRHALSERTAV